MACPTSALSALLLCLALLAGPARAQADAGADPGVWAGTAVPFAAPAVRVLQDEAGAVTFEVTATWDVPLADALAQDLGGAADALALRAVRGFATATSLVDLRAAVPPQVEILSADYDEVALSAAQREAWADALGGAAAEVASVGEYRRRVVGTLGFRLLHLEGEVLRRYRRIVVVVRRAPPPSVGLGGPAVRVQDNPHLAVTRSALAEGTWYKIPVSREGVYRIDRAYLNRIGAGSADLARVQVYGNGGRPLPALNRAPRPADLVENPTWVSGDALYFFAEAPSGWNWDAAAGRWSHFVSPFTRTTAYFLRVDTPAPRRAALEGFPAWPDAERQATIEGRLFIEEDLTNIPREGSGSGLDWMGPELSRGPVTVLDTLPPGLAGQARFRARVVARANPATTISMSVGGQTLASVAPPPIFYGDATGAVATARLLEGSVANPARLATTFRSTGGNAAAESWLDWLEVTVPQAPRAQNGLLRWATPGGRTGRFETLLEGFAAPPEVWDVTEPGAIRRLAVVAEGDRYRVQVHVAEGERPREMVAFAPNAAAVRTPAPAERLANQNLHGLAGSPDYVVVAHPAFLAAAQRLAEHRRTADGLRPLVVTTDQVFNEFGGGVSDMRAIRDFARFLYDRAPQGALPRYLLLFGDGHYDFRGIEGGPPNFVPTFQTDESLLLEQSYTSDDYFGLLGPDEGAWVWRGTSQVSSERVDIGVGRLPVRTAADADAMVSKIIRYDDAATRGEWRARYTLVADDQFPNAWDADLHVQNIETVGALVESLRPEVTTQRIYSPSYPLVTTAAGRRRPQANEAIRRSFDEGTLLWNYSGHGGPFVLADERLYTRELLDGLSNGDRPAILITATCSFGKFDMVQEQSLAEETLLARDRGAVALFTTVRVVYTSSAPNTLNTGINIALNQALLTPDADGQPRRLGEAIMLAKNTTAGAQDNNRKFNLLGDPAMRIGLPRQGVALTAVNGQALGGGAGPLLRAFERATVTGHVAGPDGRPDPTFEGEVTLTVFDAEREVTLPPGACCFTGGRYRTRTDRIYSGRASVRAGRFEAEFLVPQDVSYSGQPARIAAYARAAGGRDGFGDSRGARVATEAAARPDDREGPRIRLFLDDTTFVDGGIARPDPLLIARLADESGINTVGAGVGHELLLTINGDIAGALDVGRFYEGDLDTYRSGTVRYPLRPLAPGPHTLRLTAWDAANNASTAELSFVVGAVEALAVRNLYPYPNPTPGPTRFMFEHNRPPGTAARVQLRIYTVNGRPVRTIDGDEALPGGVLGASLVQIPWNGLDDDLDPLASGVYLFKLRVETEGEGGGRSVTERVERLAIIR